MRFLTITILAASLCSPAAAFDFRPHELNIDAGGGRSLTSAAHGQARFRTIQLELVGHSNWIAHWIPKTDAGVSIAYSDIRQPRSWFGHQFGDPDDSVRGEWAYLFLRRGWRNVYAELGTGPMWSNRRVPAATARFNFHSQLGIGVRLLNATAHPMYVEYRFSHISNLVFGPHNPGSGKRNPGWDMNTILLGTRLRIWK